MIERASFSREAAPALAGDAALVAAIAAGDRDALARLYDAYSPLLFGLAKRMLGNVAAAEDLIHDVFLEVWLHAAEYSAERGSVPAWLTVRTRSRALDRLGKSTRDARAVERATNERAESTAAVAPASVDGARLRQAAQALSEDLVAVLELAYFEGLSSSEIATRLNTPVGTVKSRMARALAALREAMGFRERGAP
jgi:RNA polymerase sigma-70 factor (ECF subfamily)